MLSVSCKLFDFSTSLFHLVSVNIGERGDLRTTVVEILDQMLQLLVSATLKELLLEESVKGYQGRRSDDGEGDEGGMDGKKAIL